MNRLLQQHIAAARVSQMSQGFLASSRIGSVRVIEPSKQKFPNGDRVADVAELLAPQPKLLFRGSGSGYYITRSLIHVPAIEAAYPPAARVSQMSQRFTASQPKTLCCRLIY